jgi:subtilisin family serine protease
VAPAAEMVFVTYSSGGSSIIDGINYIYQIADSLNRPAVVNLSLGSHIGPHDGTSILDQALSSLTGSPGKIIVGAAGNEGNSRLFLSKTFGSSTDTTNLISLVEFEDESGTGIIDMWGSTGTSFEAQILIYDALGNLLRNTGFVSSSTIDSIGTGFEYFLDGQLVRIIFAGTPAASINGKPNLLVSIENAGTLRIALEVKSGVSNTVRCWNHGLGSGAGFSNEIRGFRLRGFTPGSNQSTVGEIGSTAKGIISVGAYTTQNEYTDIFGFPRKSPSYAPNGALAPFSSQGPTADGRTKPDITAPGNVVLSAMSRFYLDAPTEILVQPRWYEGNISWGYAALPGTSMAAPVISGVAALLLEADKSLTAGQLLDILQRTAKQDKFTDTSLIGKNRWGAGKVNAWAALQAVTGYTNLDTKENKILQAVIYPNPSRDGAILHIFTIKGQTLEITLYDIAGRKLDQFISRSSDTMFSQLLPAHLSSGIYLLQIRSDTGLQASIRWVVE